MYPLNRVDGFWEKSIPPPFESFDTLVAMPCEFESNTRCQITFILPHCVDKVFAVSFQHRSCIRETSIFLEYAKVEEDETVRRVAR